MSEPLIGPSLDEILGRSSTVDAGDKLATEMSGQEIIVRRSTADISVGGDKLKWEVVASGKLQRKKTKQEALQAARQIKRDMGGTITVRD